MTTQPTLEKILVAIDFSEHSSIALEQAMLIAADKQGAVLVLLWVDTQQHEPHRAGLDSSSVQDNTDTDTSQYNAESRAKLELMADRARARNIQVSVQILSGYADEAIARVAREIGAVLIVIGTRGLTGFKRFLLGSVAEKVVRTSSTNVLVARGQPKAFSRILVATDFSPASEHALQLGIALASPDAHVDVLHAWQYPLGTRAASTARPTEGPLADIKDEVVQRIDKLGANLTRRYASSSRHIEFTNLFGAPGAVIHERLESNMYDLVAMGTHGHRGFRRFLLGSVAEATVRHAPCSVLITHDVTQSDG